MKRRKDWNQYVGKKYNHLLIESIEDDGKWIMANCLCDCGNCKKININNIITGKTTNCGCVHKLKVKEANSKSNTYDLSGDYGIGYTTKGEEFYFDLEDYDKIKDYCWSKKDGYLRARYYDKNIKMHRLIMELFENDDRIIDHKNHQRHDNRKSNLRVCNQFNNAKNIPLSSNNTSGCTGVSFNKASQNYEAYITVNRKVIKLGRYNVLEDAIRVRKEAEEKYFGEWSYDNSMKIS